MNALFLFQSVHEPGQSYLCLLNSDGLGVDLIYGLLVVPYVIHLRGVL